MKNKAGLPVPRAYLYHLIAQRWGVPRPLVPDFPACEIELEVKLMQLEAQRKDGR